MKMRIRGEGHCGVNGVHPRHLYAVGGVDNDDNALMSECPGQYSHCINCDDRGCMDCVLRVWHDECAWSCPSCEEGEAEYVLRTLGEIKEAPPTAFEVTEWELRNLAQEFEWERLSLGEFLTKAKPLIEALEKLPKE